MGHPRAMWDAQTNSAMSLRQFYDGVCSDEKSALQFFLDNGVLSPSPRCEFKRDGVDCGSEMYLGNRQGISSIVKIV